jgi:hypothetical protein
VAGQDDAGRLALAQRGEQVGLGLVGVEGQARTHAQALQLVADGMDEVEVAVGADGVHAHQRLCERQGAGRQRGECGHGTILADNPSCGGLPPGG